MLHGTDNKVLIHYHNISGFNSKKHIRNVKEPRVHVALFVDKEVSVFIVTIKIPNKTVSVLITGRPEHDVQIAETRSHKTTFNHAFEIYPTSNKIQHDLIYSVIHYKLL